MSPTPLANVAPPRIIAAAASCAGLEGEFKPGVAVDQIDPLFDIAGKRYLLAGAGGGLGAPVAAALLARGARLVLADLTREAAAGAIPEGCGAEQAVACALDMRDEESIAAAIALTVETFGGIDGVINAAGVLAPAPSLTMEAEVFRATVDINLTGAFLLTRHAAKAMAAGGRIVHIVSASALVANEGFAAYAGSKAGLAHVIRVAAREFAGQGITVNGIGPAVTETAMTKDQMADEAWRAGALSLIPMGRFGRADDLIGTLVLLLSEGGGFITGQTVFVDGGRTLV